MKNLFNKYSIIFLFFLSGIAGLGFSLYMHYHSDASLPPPTLQGYHYPLQFLAPLKNDPQAGRKIFNEYCASCHGTHPLIDIDAPRIGDKAAWKRRRQSGFQVLFKHTLNGIGAMSARGGCFECTDQQLRMSICYLLDK